MVECLYTGGVQFDNDTEHGIQHYVEDRVHIWTATAKFIAVTAAVWEMNEMNVLHTHS